MEHTPNEWVCMKCGSAVNGESVEELTLAVPELVDREAEKAVRSLKAQLVGLVKDHIHLGFELIKLRDFPELYRSKGYASFYKFLEEEVGIPRQTASAHIRAAERLSTLPESVQEQLSELPWARLSRLLSLPQRVVKDLISEPNKAQKFKAQTGEEFLKEIRRIRQRYINEITALKNELERKRREIKERDLEIYRLKREGVFQKPSEDAGRLRQHIKALEKRIEELEREEVSYRKVLRRWRANMDRVLDVMEELAAYEVPEEIVPEIYAFFGELNKKIQTLHRKLEEKNRGRQDKEV